jgi:hypothetical protein
MKPTSVDCDSKLKKEGICSDIDYGLAFLDQLSAIMIK